MREIVDRDAVEQAVQAAMQASGLKAPDGIYSGPVNIGPLGTSGQSVMEGEPMTLAPVFDKNDVAGSLAAGLVPTQKDIADIYAPYILGSKRPEKTFNEIRLLEEAGYPLIIDGKQYAPTSTISHIQDGRFIPKTSGLTESKSPMSTMVEPEVTPMDNDIDRAIASALASGGDMPMQADDDPVMAAVETAVGNGQPTTDDAILDEDDMQFGTQLMSYYYNPATGETYDSTGSLDTPPEGFIPIDENYTPGMGTETPAQPDFMTQLNELIASMQAEQTAAAEAQAAAEAERQKQAAEMTQNYTIGQPAVGYNPYESGQYQNNPYGAAGVPAMGGITTIPVPAAYTPNPYLTGGMT